MNYKVWKRVGIGLLIGSPILAISPVLLALILVPLTCGGFEQADESNCGAAAMPWLLFASVPVGILLFIVGTVVTIVGFSKQNKFQGQQPPVHPPIQYPDA